MRVDPERAEAWYKAISDYLEQNAGNDDAKSPWSLVAALCRVVADATVATDGDDEQKVEAVARLVGAAMGHPDVMVVIARDVPPEESN
jgi:hypothetical protein